MFAISDGCVTSWRLKLLFSHVIGCIVEFSFFVCDMCLGWLSSLSHVDFFILFIIFSLDPLYSFYIFYSVIFFIISFCVFDWDDWSWLCPIGVHMNNQSCVKIRDPSLLKLINVKMMKYMWKESVWNMRVRVCQIRK